MQKNNPEMLRHKRFMFVAVAISTLVPVVIWKCPSIQSGDVVTICVSLAIGYSFFDGRLRHLRFSWGKMKLEVTSKDDLSGGGSSE